LEVDYLNEQYGLGIPSGPYETLGGWVMEMLGEIPQAGTVWTEGPLEIRVEAVTLTRIDLVRIKRLAPVEAD
jgi:CBS domain containing-hemolysin-like protein